MKKEKQRTLQQNRALHLAFTQLGDALNSQGLTMLEVLKKNKIQVPWSGETIKEYMWRPIQNALLMKKSTTELTTTEIDKVFEIIHKHLVESFPGIDLPKFPSIESMMIDMEERKAHNSMEE